MECQIYTVRTLSADMYDAYVLADEVPRSFLTGDFNGFSGSQSVGPLDIGLPPVQITYSEIEKQTYLKESSDFNETKERGFRGHMPHKNLFSALDLNPLDPWISVYLQFGLAQKEILWIKINNWMIIPWNGKEH